MSITELAHFSLFLAFCIAFLQVVLPAYGIFSKKLNLQKTAPALAVIQLVAVLFSFFGLMAGFYINDFSLIYIANHSNIFLPWYYKLSATWAGHEGSLLLWVTILAAWSAMVACLNKKMQLALKTRVLVVLASIQVMMLVMLLFTSSPFIRSIAIGVNNQLFITLPVDGANLNPLLQDIGLILHPPMLYMGYVGMAVPFAFFVAALWAGRLDASWVRWARPWVLVAWAFLTLGIALGSWWAYYELGWGGWWFWDPVENASLMPWLVCTALIHALAVTQKRGVFKAWSIMLAICAFALSLLGTFLVRSGVVGSVHAFASDPTRGLFILLILFLVIGVGLFLFAMRGWRLTVESNYQLNSKESLIVINNIILLVATLVVLLGTLYPIIADTFELGQVSVGPPYFNTFFVPLTWLLLFVMGLGPVVGWQQQKRPLLGVSTAIVLSSLLLVAIVFVVFKPSLPQNGSLLLNLPIAITLALCFWVLGWALYDVKNRVKHASNFCSGVVKLPISYWGMQLAHIGVLLAALGVAVTTSQSIQKDVALAVGDTVSVHGYEFTLMDVYTVNGKNYQAITGKVVVNQKTGESNGNVVAILYPQKRSYVSNALFNAAFNAASNMPTTEAAINGNLWRDIYVAMGEAITDDNNADANNVQATLNSKWAMRIYLKPFVRLIWFGAILMVLGGLLSAKRFLNKKSINK